MRLNFIKYLAVTATLLCFSNMSFAGSVTSCAAAAGYSDGTKDFGDATTDSEGKAYVQACHETNAWQQLGSAGANGITNTMNDINSANEGWNGESSQKAVDTGDNGVSWRVADENGVFGAYGQPELTLGQTVEFKFDVTRSQKGTHKFDQLSAWIDWNGQDGFHNRKMDHPTKSGGERLLTEKWYKDRDINDNKTGAYTTNINTDLSTARKTKYNHVDTFRSYTVTTTIPMDALVGKTWLRARIVCENSLTTHASNMNLLATGYHDQGEVEDYQLTINARPATPVPEPTTLFVFGTALIGLVLSRKKAK
jgi:hypothetical protein